jgi:hypothetical protein
MASQEHDEFVQEKIADDGEEKTDRHIQASRMYTDRLLIPLSEQETGRQRIRRLFDGLRGTYQHLCRIRWLWLLLRPVRHAT